MIGYWYSREMSGLSLLSALRPRPLPIREQIPMPSETSAISPLINRLPASGFGASLHPARDVDCDISSPNGSFRNSHEESRTSLTDSSVAELLMVTMNAAGSATAVARAAALANQAPLCVRTPSPGSPTATISPPLYPPADHKAEPTSGRLSRGASIRLLRPPSPNSRPSSRADAILPPDLSSPAKSPASLEMGLPPMPAFGDAEPARPPDSWRMSLRRSMQKCEDIVVPAHLPPEHPSEQQPASQRYPEAVLPPPELLTKSAGEVPQPQAPRPIEMLTDCYAAPRDVACDDGIATEKSASTSSNKSSASTSGRASANEVATGGEATPHRPRQITGCICLAPGEEANVQPPTAPLPQLLPAGGGLSLRNSQLRESGAARAVQVAESYGLRVCGVEVGSLLREQITVEAEVNRLVEAWSLIKRCLEALTPATLNLVLKLSKPPPMLEAVLEALMILIETNPHGGAAQSCLPRAQVRAPALPWHAVHPLELHTHMKNLAIDDVTPDQLGRLGPLFERIEYSELKKQFGVASFMWMYVSAACVICASPHATLPAEDEATIRASRRFSQSDRAPLPRTCNGAPITGRPSYSTTSTAEKRNQLTTSTVDNCGLVSCPQLNEATSAWHAPNALSQLTPLKFLGAGAFANVFMCRHQQTGELVALKCILKSLVLKKRKQHQVRTEKGALSCSPHPNVIRLHAVFADAQHLYFAMELAVGGELFALIEEKDRVAEPATKYYAASVTLALAHLHAHGFIYRDLKPENLLLDSSGRLKVCDLGLAKQAQRTYSVVGTPQYVAPELLRGEGATFASDWWALGVLIFEMSTGDLPFTAPDGSDITLFGLIRKGMYTWDRPARPDRPRAVSVSEPPSIMVKDAVRGLLSLAVPPATEAEQAARAAELQKKEAEARADKKSKASSRPVAPQPLAPPLKRTPRASLGPLRLGSAGRGVAEVRGHQWFRGFNFDALLAGNIPAPYVPNLRGDDDDANFGPIDWRGEPVLTSPDYDASTWDTLWNAEGEMW